MPKVLVLHTGGTLMMQAGAGASRAGAPLTPDVYGRDLAAELPSLVRIADLETRILFTMDSGDMQPADWIAIAREVHAAAADPGIDGIVDRPRDRYDGVHGERAGAPPRAAAEACRAHGGQRPLAACAHRCSREPDRRRPRRDAPGPRGRRSRLPRVRCGESCDEARRVGVRRLRLAELRPARRARAGRRRREARARTRGPRARSTRVSTLACSPCGSFRGSIRALLRGAVSAGVRGLVLEAYGTGNLPHLGGSLIPALEEAREMRGPGPGRLAVPARVRRHERVRRGGRRRKRPARSPGGT